MYVFPNIEAHSCNHCCSRRVMNITQHLCVFVALYIQHHIVMWPAPLYNIFQRYPINGTIKKNSFWIQNVCLDFLYNFVWNIFQPTIKFSEIWLILYIVLHVKYLLFLSDFNEIRIFSIDFRKILRYQISWKSVEWEPNCSMWTDRHDEANSRLSHFCESA
jgi:hypothetical protein